MIQIAVMEAGRLSEMGHPGELLSRGGAFAKMVEALGTEAAAALQNKARGATSVLFPAEVTEQTSVA